MENTVALEFGVSSPFDHTKLARKPLSTSLANQGTQARSKYLSGTLSLKEDILKTIANFLRENCDTKRQKQITNSIS